MKKTVTLNPFSIFFIIILGVLLVYSFGWSTINPAFTVPTWLFFGFVLISLLLFSVLFNYFFPAGTFKTERSRVSLIPWTVIGIGSMVAEFVYEGVVPIVEILFKKSGYDYFQFKGIPMFHVFAVTFTSFLGVYYWSTYLKEKKIHQLFFSILFVSYPILLFNRGGFIMNLCSMFFVFFIQKKNVRVSLKKVFVFVLVIIGLLYLFGLFGNIRSDSVRASKDITDSSFILRSGRATEEFKDSSIPKPFFWAYLYITTPIANLQNMIEHMSPADDSMLFVTQNIVPDFVGKRIEKGLNRTVPKDKLISPVFNVSTMFAPAFKTLGFIGLFLGYLYLVIFIFLYSVLMKRMNTAKIVGIAILFTMTVFNMFSNMLVFSGLSFQLIYPIVFGIYKKI